MKSVLIGIAVFMIALSHVEPEIFAESAVQNQIREVRHEIVLLNLINGLYLIPEQITMIYQKNEEAEDIRNHFQLEVENQSEEIIRGLMTLRTVLAKNEAIPEGLAQEIHQVQEKLHEIEDREWEKLLKIENEIENCLTENQHVIIEEYKPCLIPPKTGMIGQSVDTEAERLVKFLTRVRGMRESHYDMTREMMLDLYVEKIEHHVGMLEPDEKTQLRDEALSVFEEVRSLSDQEFLVRRSELAKRLMQEPIRPGNRRKNQFGRVGQFLLDPLMIPLLKSSM